MARLVRFLAKPHVPWAVKSRSLTLYRLLRYGSVNPNTRRYWDRIYREELARGENRQHDYTALHDAILERVGTGSYLDVGCGTGDLLRKVARIPGIRPHACDLSPVAVEAVRSLCLEARVINLPHVPTEWRGRFDILTCTEVLEHLTDVDAALSAMAACLGPEGTLLVSVPDDCMHPEEFHEHMQSFDRERLEGLLGRRFREVEVLSVEGDGENRYLLGRGTGPRSPEG